MDPFTTPPSAYSVPYSTTTDHLISLSKSAVIDLIRKVPFDEIFIPKSVVSNEQESTPSFLEAVGFALIRAFTSHPPAKTSPRKLLSSSASLHTSRVEPETPTKSRIVNPEETPRDVITKERQDVSKFEVNPSVDKRRLQALKSIEDVPEQHPLYPPARSFTPPKLEWDHPRPNFHDGPAHIDDARKRALEKLDLDRDPFYITRLERKPESTHPFVSIRGEIQIPYVDDGNLVGGFTKEFYDANGLALLDSGGEACLVCDDFLGLELNTRKRVLFNFEIRGVNGLIIKTIAKVVPRSSLPNNAEGINIILGQAVCFPQDFFSYIQSAWTVYLFKSNLLSTLFQT